MIVLLTSLPTIVTNQVFGLNGADMANPLTLSQSMTRLSGVVADTLEAAHQAALEQVNDLITEGGYDQELSLEALDDQAGDSSYDVAYVLCAYSVSMEQLGTSEEDMVRKLSNLADKLFLVTYEVKTAEVQAEQDTSSKEEESSSDRPPDPNGFLPGCHHPPFEPGRHPGSFPAGSGSNLRGLYHHLWGSYYQYGHCPQTDLVRVQHRDGGRQHRYPTG